MASSPQPFSDLTPEFVMDAIEQYGVSCDGRIYPLNSYENRVYQVGIEDEPRPWIAKFYRCDRWQNEQIQEEIDFCHRLADEGMRVCEPFVFDDNQSLLTHGNYRFTLAPKLPGTAPEPDNLDQLYAIGQTLGQMHRIAGNQVFTYRPELSVKRMGLESVEALTKAHHLSPRYAADFVKLARELLTPIAEMLSRKPLQLRRIQGDCHLGNILWHEGSIALVDFDDCMNGPAVQDFWMLLAGDRQQKNLQLSTLIEGYEEWCEFDRHEIRCIEALRTLRLIHYTAWLSQRCTETAFKHAFSWFGTQEYWQGQIKNLERQKKALSEEPLLFKGHSFGNL